MAKNNFKKRPKVLKDEKFWRFTKKSSLEIHHFWIKNNVF